MKPLRLLTIINFLFFLSGKLAAQNCIPTHINGAVINFACNQLCPGLNFQIPHIKSSDDYTVVSALYQQKGDGDPDTLITISDFVYK